MSASARETRSRASATVAPLSQPKSNSSSAPAWPSVAKVFISFSPSEIAQLGLERLDHQTLDILGGGAGQGGGDVEDRHVDVRAALFGQARIGGDAGADGERHEGEDHAGAGERPVDEADHCAALRSRASAPRASAGAVRTGEPSETNSCPMVITSASPSRPSTQTPSSVFAQGRDRGEARAAVDGQAQAEASRAVEGERRARNQMRRPLAERDGELAGEAVADLIGPLGVRRARLDAESAGVGVGLSAPQSSRALRFLGPKPAAPAPARRR